LAASSAGNYVSLVKVLYAEAIENVKKNRLGYEKDCRNEVIKTSPTVLPSK
jgi:hypothetical protein